MSRKFFLLLIAVLSELANVTVSRFIGAHRIEQEAEHRVMLMFQKAFKKLFLLLCGSHCFSKLHCYIHVVGNTLCFIKHFQTYISKAGLWKRGDL